MFIILYHIFCELFNLGKMRARFMAIHERKKYVMKSRSFDHAVLFLSPWQNEKPKTQDSGLKTKVSVAG